MSPVQTPATQRILVTGGAGFIGSHTCVALIQSGYDVLVVDNLCNSSTRVLEGIERITGTRPRLVITDLLDLPSLTGVVAEYAPHAVIHFAGLKAVGESVKFPLRYYQNNVVGSINLLQVMQAAGVHNLVFSSSCTVYGVPDHLPIREDAPVGNTTSPYGHSKYLVESILREVHANNSAWNVSILRYFNPVGAHPSGEIGEDPQGVPDNLMPYVCQVAVGKREVLRVWGDDYDTRDGTGVRDYLHVCDLADGHVKALQKLQDKPGLMIHNLGTGEGKSVLEIVTAFRKASGQAIPYEVMARRPGDIAQTWADPQLAEQELGWKAHRSLEQICKDAWNWQQKYPDGF